MQFGEYIKMISNNITILVFVSTFSILLFRPGPVEAKLIPAPSGTITPFIVSVTPAPDGEIRERLQDVVGRLQSIVSRLRGVTQDSRSYGQAFVRERGADVSAVERVLTRAEDQLNRADAQVVALSKLFHELDAGTSDEVVLLNARTQFRRIRTTMLSGRDLLRNALDELQTLDQQPSPTPSPSSGPSATPTPTL